MNITVLSRSKAKEFSSEVPWACISIGAEEGDWPKLCGVKRLGLLQLAFPDFDLPREVTSGSGWKLFDETHAVRILDFVNEMKPKVEAFMIHCLAGVSRSSAVAAALAKIAEGDDSEFFGKHYVPNMLVYSKLLEVAHERGEYDPASFLK